MDIGIASDLSGLIQALVARVGHDDMVVTVRAI